MKKAYDASRRDKPFELVFLASCGNSLVSNKAISASDRSGILPHARQDVLGQSDPKQHHDARSFFKTISICITQTTVQYTLSQSNLTTANERSAFSSKSASDLLPRRICISTIFKNSVCANDARISMQQRHKVGHRSHHLN